MASHEYIRYIPSWRRPPTSDESSDSRIQMSPTSAIATSESRARMQNILTGLTMLMVLAILFIGTRYYQTQSAKLDVSASVDMAHSVTGAVASVDYRNNSFTLLYSESRDPDIAALDVPKWTVYLPPGEKFTGKQTMPLKVCMTVPDFSSLTSATPQTCASVIQPGRSVLVEYLIVNADAQTLVAKTVIGTGR